MCEPPQKGERSFAGGRVRLLIRDYATWEVVSNTPESILQALDIETRYMTSFWMCSIFQTRHSAGASIFHPKTCNG